MSGITIRKVDITTLDVDAIVNAANSGLHAGGGVCGAIFRAAGYKELGRACDRYQGCDTGKAAITPGFHLPAKYVIHAVGPIWNGGESQEAEKLYSAYTYSLYLAMKNECHSIAFPLISSGIYGYPKKEAWYQALTACKRFLAEHPEYEMDITFAVLGDGVKILGEKVEAEIDAMSLPDCPIEIPTEKELEKLSMALQTKKRFFGIF